MSAVVDVKHKKAPIDHIVVKLSVMDARDLVAAYKEVHSTNRHFFDLWGRLPQLVDQITQAIGAENVESRRIRKHPDGGYAMASTPNVDLFATLGVYQVGEVATNERSKP